MGHGNCESADNTGTKWCFVGTGSTCQDIQTTKKGPYTKDWSYEACTTPVCDTSSEFTTPTVTPITSPTTSPATSPTTSPTTTSQNGNLVDKRGKRVDTQGK